MIGWARNVEYIVWVDADLIVLDMGLDIQQVSDQYPDAHILASADIRLGMINSGTNWRWLKYNDYLQVGCTSTVMFIVVRYAYM